MPRTSDIVVIPRHRRWEIAVRGITRPLVDWFATKERAIDHAYELAPEVDATAIVVESGIGDVETVLPVRRGSGGRRRQDRKGLDHGNGRRGER